MFRCPAHFDKYRVAYHGEMGNETHGFLHIKDRGLGVMFSNSGGWEHVSVSRRRRMPSYQDMDAIRRAFWSADCTVMQLHVPDAEHIDLHPYCLHLWRPTQEAIPRPPHYMVADDPAQSAAQNLPDEFLKAHIPSPCDHFMGVPIDRLTREELMAVCMAAHRELQEQQEEHSQRLDLLTGRH